MEIRERLEWIRWIEKIPCKRTKGMSFGRDDNFFWAQLQKGLLYEKLVAKILRGKGIKPVNVVGGDSDTFRDKIDNIGVYSRKARDIVIKGYNFEIKSRSIEFTTPDNWPKKLLPIHIDTVSSVDEKNFPVAGYIFISQKTGCLMGISYRSKEYWKKNKGRDNVRNLKDTFYSAPLRYFYGEAELLRKLQKMEPNKEIAKAIS
jgi:hypothetical protein